MDQHTLDRHFASNLQPSLPVNRRLNMNDGRGGLTSSVATVYPFGVSNLNGYLQQYTHFKHVEGDTFGMKRVRLFFKLLTRSDRLIKFASPASQFSLRFTVLDIEALPSEFSSLAAYKNAGINGWGIGSETSSRFSNFNNSTFPINILNPYIENVDGVTGYNTPIVRRGTGSHENFVKELFDSFMSAVPQGGDSGIGDVLRIFNIFLVQWHTRRGGDNTNLTKISKKKSVFVPKTTKNCFWHCLYYHLNIRRMTSKQITRTVAKDHVNLIKEADLYCEEIETGTASFSDVDRHCSKYFLTPTIVDIDGNVIHGNNDDLHLCSITNGRIMLAFIDNHYCLVKSWTAFLNIATCNRCDKKFKSSIDLTKHLNSKKCLTCNCKFKYQKKHKRTLLSFDTEKEWRDHNDHPTECAHNWTHDYEREYLEFENLIVDDQEELKHDIDKRKIREKNRFMMPTRSKEETKDITAIFFDLESIVPINYSGETSSDEFLPQIPYAAGWITSKELEKYPDGGSDAKKAVTISYGLHCISDFIEWLDNIYETTIDKARRDFHQSIINNIQNNPTTRSNNVRTTRGKMERWISKNCPLSDNPILDYSNHLFERELDSPDGSTIPLFNIYAHNGGKYDWLFIHRFFITSGRCDEIQTVRSKGRYISLTYKKIFRFMDTFLFLSTSLASLARDFKIPTSKGIFPYKFMDSTDKINVVLQGESECRDKLPPHLFDCHDKLPGPMGLSVKRPMNEDEYSDYMSNISWTFDTKAITIDYLEDDVLCLGYIVREFRKGWVDMPHSPEFYNSVTIGQLSHNYFRNHYMHSNKYTILSPCEDSMFRKASYGGRVETFVHRGSGGPYNYVDINSLYPYVMEKFDLPGGDPHWNLTSNHVLINSFMREIEMPPYYSVKEDDYFSELADLINNSPDEISESHFGFIEADVIPPDAFISPNYIPVIPERVNMGSSFKNMFTLQKKTKAFHFLPEILYAIKRGYKVENVTIYVEFERVSHYKEFIDNMKTMKIEAQREGNASKRACSKLAQNSAYGKLLQMIKESREFVGSRDELFNIMEDTNGSCEVWPVFRNGISDVVEVIKKDLNPRKQPRSSACAGAAVLAYAKMVLYDYMEIVQNDKGTVLYCDTDSIIYEGNPLPDYCIHDSEYGKMKVEIPSDEILDFVSVGPKFYAFKLSDDNHGRERPYIRCKGVPMSTNFKSLNSFMESAEFDDCIDESESGINFDILCKLVSKELKCISTTQMQFKANRARDISAIMIDKKLKSISDKRRVLGNYTSVPWTRYNYKIDECIEKEEDEYYVVDFISFASDQDREDADNRYNGNKFWEKCKTMFIELFQ